MPARSALAAAGAALAVAAVSLVVVIGQDGRAPAGDGGEPATTVVGRFSERTAWPGMTIMSVHFVPHPAICDGPEPRAGQTAPPRR